MERAIYKIDEVAKTILLGLERTGRQRSFAQILEDARVNYTNDIQIEVANTLEALGLIVAASYKLPLEIHAELSETGKTIVTGLKKSKHQASPGRNFHFNISDGNQPGSQLGIE